MIFRLQKSKYYDYTFRRGKQLKGVISINQHKNSTNRNYNRTIRLNRVFINSKLKTSGLSSGLYPFIMELAERNGLSLHELSNSVCVDSSYTTRALDKLIKLKYVEKKTNQLDLRALEISLTDKGKKLNGKIKTIIDEWNGIIFNNLTEEELKTYEAITNKIHANASDYFVHNGKKYGDND